MPSEPIAAARVCNIACCGRQISRVFTTICPNRSPSLAANGCSSPAATTGSIPGTFGFSRRSPRLGDLYVVVGHDANIKLLKGEGHPLFPDYERRYLVQSVCYVRQALISTGHGWLDAEPEIRRIKPHIYAVNEDGDRPEKRQYCQTHGIEYRVLQRLPKQGLPQRQSKDLRGF